MVFKYVIPYSLCREGLARPWTTSFEQGSCRYDSVARALKWDSSLLEAGADLLASNHAVGGVSCSKDDTPWANESARKFQPKEVMPDTGLW